MPCPHCLYTCLGATAAAIRASYREWRGRARRHWRTAPRGPVLCARAQRLQAEPAGRGRLLSFPGATARGLPPVRAPSAPPRADVRTARRRWRRGRRRTRHGRHRRDGRDGRRRRRGRHNQLPSLRGWSAPRTGQLYHRQTGLTAVASCRSMPCRFRSKRTIFFVFLEKYGSRCLPSRVEFPLCLAVEISTLCRPKKI